MLVAVRKPGLLGIGSEVGISTHKKAMLHSFVDTKAQMGQGLLDGCCAGPSRRHHNDAHWLLSFDSRQAVNETAFGRSRHVSVASC